MRFDVLAGLLCCSLLFAQSPTDVFEQAPPAVEKALRDRIAIFMAAHISGKFRNAEEVIHDDSKDIYYDSVKSKFISYEIVRINYAENFTKATVVTAVEMDWYTTRLGKLRVKPPLTTTWKLDNGEWWWYAVPQKEWKTPFGTMSPGQDSKPGIPVAPVNTVADANALYQQIQVSKTDIPLSSWQAGEDSAEIVNKTLGEITLKLNPVTLPPELTVELSKEILASGETAKVIFKHSPADRTVKQTRTVSVSVSPTNQVFTFNVTFSVPPEYEKYLKKPQ